MFQYSIIVLIAMTLFYTGCGNGQLGCKTTYTRAGLVTDVAYNPLPEVEIRFQYDPISPTTILGKTDSQGMYTFYAGESVAPGKSIEFFKAGYNISVSEPYTVFETSAEVCGAVTLRRDAILQLQ